METEQNMKRILKTVFFVVTLLALSSLTAQASAEGGVEYLVSESEGEYILSDFLP